MLRVLGRTLVSTRLYIRIRPVPDRGFLKTKLDNCTRSCCRVAAAGQGVSVYRKSPVRRDFAMSIEMILVNARR